MTEPTREQFDVFLDELSSLTIKHGLVVGGCGCCGSPFVESHSKPKAGRYILSDDGDGLTWKEQP